MASEYNDNVQLNAPKALDDRNGKFVNGVWQPFASVAEAKSMVINYRHKGLIQFILKNGIATEYWYRDGVTDNDLIEKLVVLTPFDVEITDATKGIIGKSPNGTRWRMTFNNDGSMKTTAL